MFPHLPHIERKDTAVKIHEGCCAPDEILHHAISEAMQLGHRLALEGKRIKEVNTCTGTDFSGSRWFAFGARVEDDPRNL